MPDICLEFKEFEQEYGSCKKKNIKKRTVWFLMPGYGVRSFIDMDSVKASFLLIKKYYCNLSLHFLRYLLGNLLLYLVCILITILALNISLYITKWMQKLLL